MSKILLGKGVFKINGTSVGLTRGGGEFTIETELREIEADGDYGPVKDRIDVDKVVPKLKMNFLKILAANIPKMYPAQNLDTSDSGKDVVTGKTEIATTDYQNVVSWTGATKDGKQVHIEVHNAINLEGLNWSLLDKDEVVPEVTYTGTYTEETRETPPYKIEFVKGDTYSVTFNVDDGVADVEGAEITFNNQTKETNASGQAVFTGVPVGNNQAFSIVAGGFVTYTGSANVVDANVTVEPTLTAI